MACSNRNFLSMVFPTVNVVEYNAVIKETTRLFRMLYNSLGIRWPFFTQLLLVTLFTDYSVNFPLSVLKQRHKPAKSGSRIDIYRCLQERIASLQTPLAREKRRRIVR